MVVDDTTTAGEVVIGTTFACEGCAGTALVLSPVGFGFLFGSAVVCLVAALWFALGKETHGWIAATFSVGLAVFFGFLAQLRRSDERKNPPIG